MQSPSPARVIDKYNAKVFRVRFEKHEDVVRLQDGGLVDVLPALRVCFAIECSHKVWLVYLMAQRLVYFRACLLQTVIQTFANRRHWSSVCCETEKR